VRTQLTFTSGQTQRTVTVSLTNDSVAENSETFGLLVQRNSSDPAGTFLAKATFTIADDDQVQATSYSISPGSITANENAGTVTFTVSRSGGLPAETLFVSTSTGEGSSNSNDYTGKLNEQLTFTSGQTQRTVTVSLTNDSAAENSETFGLLVQRNSSDPASTFLAKATFTIADDDQAQATSYSISPSSITVNENAGTVTFTVSRSGGLPAETLFVSTSTGEGSSNSMTTQESSMSS
jgi:Calx-beta domain